MVDVRKIDEFFNGERPFSENGNKARLKVNLLHVAKFVMPSVAAVIIGFMLVFPSLKKEVVVNTDIAMPKKGELEKIHIEKTVFSITNAENQVSVITADSIDELEAGSKFVKIINLKGSLPTGKKGDMADLQAKTGYYNQNRSYIKVEDDVRVVYADGSTVTTQSGEYDFNKSYGFGKDEIYAKGPWGNLFAQGFEYNQKQEWLNLYGNSKVVTEEGTLTAEKSIKYYRAENVLEAFGNVKLVAKENTLYADKIKAELTSGKKPEIKKIEAFGNIKVENKDGVAKGNYAVFEPQKQQIELSDNVSIEKDGNIIYGQKAVTNLKTSVSKIVSDSKTKRRVSGIIKGSLIKVKNNE